MKIATPAANRGVPVLRMQGCCIIVEIRCVFGIFEVDLLQAPAYVPRTSKGL
jgi:hypothetical protein